MIEKYDELEKKASMLVGKDITEAKKVIKQKEEVLKKMKNEEIELLLKRPYPAQYKNKLKNFLKK